jgi:hypothetical protein
MEELDLTNKKIYKYVSKKATTFFMEEHRHEDIILIKCIHQTGQEKKKAWSVGSIYAMFDDTMDQSLIKNLEVEDVVEVTDDEKNALIVLLSLDTKGGE